MISGGIGTCQEDGRTCAQNSFLPSCPPPSDCGVCGAPCDMPSGSIGTCQEDGFTCAQNSFSPNCDYPPSGIQKLQFTVNFIHMDITNEQVFPIFKFRSTFLIAILFQKGKYAKTQEKYVAILVQEQTVNAVIIWNVPLMDVVELEQLSHAKLRDQVRNASC